jgi:transposase
MGRLKRIELEAEQRAALEQGYRTGSSHAFRRRCQMILLKSQGLSSAQVSQVVGGCEVTVNAWLRRYQSEGIAGLVTRSGRGRKPILHSAQDLEAVRVAVGHNRQRIRVAKAELEQVVGKSFCERTLIRFVKKTVRAINGCENVPASSAKRSFTGTKSSA